MGTYPTLVDLFDGREPPGVIGRSVRLSNMELGTRDGFTKTQTYRRTIQRGRLREWGWTTTTDGSVRHSESQRKT